MYEFAAIMALVRTRKHHLVPNFWQCTWVVIFLSRVLARRTTKKERLEVVYNKTVVHVLLVVEHNPLPPSLVAV